MHQRLNCDLENKSSARSGATASPSPSTEDRGREDAPLPRATAPGAEPRTAAPEKIWRLSRDGYVIAEQGEATAEPPPQSAPGAKPLWRTLWREENWASVERALARARLGRAACFRTFDCAPDGDRTYWETLITPVPGRANELLAVSRDVTEAAEASALTASIINSLPSPLMVKSSGDDRPILWNPAAEAAFAINGEHTFAHDGEPDWSTEVFRLLTPCPDAHLRSGEIQIVDAVRIPARFGGGGVFDVRSYLTFDDYGERHLVLLATDIAQRLHHERELAAALVQAEQASLAKARFLTNLSHEMRTPLNGVVACADMLTRLDLPPAAEEMVAIMRAAGDTLQRLFADLLHIAHGASDAPPVAAPFHLGAALRSIVHEAVASDTSSDVDLTLELAPDADVDVIGDQGRLRQALSILIGNALKFTSAGVVTVSVSPTPEDRLRFSVRDNGVGFSAAEKTRILECFGQADDSMTRRFGGLGLGLTIAHDLLKSMGGKLDCDGRPGLGAEFWFDLALPSPAPPPPPSDPKPDLRVLVVDDHEVNRRVLELILSGLATTSTAQDGQQAVDAYMSQQPDLVLMDVQMPVMNGLEAVQAIRRYERARKLARCPIIVLTAHTGADHAARAISAGADLHLEKPITAPTLLASMNKALGKV